MNDNEKIIQLLSETVRWLRFQGLEKAKAAVAEHLDSDKKKKVFDLTDGKTSSRSLSEKTGVSFTTICVWWNEWYAAGILTKDGDKYRHLFTLSEIGMSKGSAEEGDNSLTKKNRLK